MITSPKEGSSMWCFPNLSVNRILFCLALLMQPITSPLSPNSTIPFSSDIWDHPFKTLKDFSNLHLYIYIYIYTYIYTHIYV